MLLAIDVHYRENYAKSVGILFKNWCDSEPIDIISSYSQEPQIYEPGFFYRRELPCIVELLSHINLKDIKVIIIDGYVYLDSCKKPGLGYHLYDSLNKKIPIIGVAKTAFNNNNNPDIVKEVFRGESMKPLYITAVDVELHTAADCIERMHGGFRMPTLLKLLDSQTKKIS